ncbi:hypothetical protein DV713_10970 [Parageobacillus thermoglucosidasius]|uniref:hypothetical protein n=1 Tax=Parageobacillus thermoglucosidasius TaxID=1426 RepID=UPI000E14500F|nr:hypothetical protein [Parageobacillus thermoglucosidasius]RDE34584.1 hypothetical protein DV713_10970 [Parageobacillus thermoglucosidasius]
MEIADSRQITYASLKEMKSFQFVGLYSNIGFKLGDWDAEKQENVMEDNRKFQNKKLCQAMAKAINNQEAADKPITA